MDWQDNEFEGFLKRFRLREARPLPVADAAAVPGRRAGQWKIAAAAVLVVAIGASAAIVRQLSVKSPTEVEHPEIFVGPVPIAVSSQSSTTPAATEAPTPAPPVKLDPKPRDPLKQLTKVIPPEQDAGPQSTPAPPRFLPQQDVFFITQTQTDPQTGQIVQTSQTVAAGPRILNDACGTCHSPDIVGSSHFDTREQYLDVINRMVGMGASVTEVQASVLADYLFNTYGKKKEPQPETEDRGKTAFTAACGQCHALELMDNQKNGDRVSYETLVNRMNAYGAGLTPEQVNPLVDYLFRTYGRSVPQPLRLR